MIFCILAKILPSLSGVWLSVASSHQFPLFEAFIIGVAPIWLELLASFLTKVEPSKVQSKRLLWIDAIVDVSTFIIVPVIWYWSLDPTLGVLTSVGLCGFLVSGISRIVRFLKVGLTPAGEFIGLPVTYTGYVWPALVAAEAWGSRAISGFVLLVLAWAMLSNKIRIRTAR